MAASFGDERVETADDNHHTKNGRKLRSTDGSTPSKQALFNFDNLNKILYRNEPVFIDKGTDFDHLYHYSQGPTLPTSKLINNPIIEVVEDVDDSKQSGDADTLTDEVYEIFYRKMNKDEKAMTNEEKFRILFEVDTLQCHLALLRQYDWVRHLPKFCKINDLQDADELEQKRNLTILEIEKILQKYENWKRRSERLAFDVKEFSYDDKPKIDPQDEYNLPLSEIKRNRKTESRLRYGPLIRLTLNDRYVVIIDPILPPKIVRVGNNGVETVVNNERNSIHTYTPVTIPKVMKRGRKVGWRKNSNQEFKSSAITKPKRTPRMIRWSDTDLDDPDQVDLMTSVSGDRIFGNALNDLICPRDGFQLPKEIKQFGVINEIERITFRESLTNEQNERRKENNPNYIEAAAGSTSDPNCSEEKLITSAHNPEEKLATSANGQHPSQTNS